MRQETAPAHWEHAAGRRRTTGFGSQRIAGALVRMSLRALMAGYAATRRRGTSRRVISAPLRALVTLTTHSDAWALAHLRPLALSAPCAGVTAVTARPLPAIEGVTCICPPAWLARVLGEVPARLLTFARVAVRTRPDLIGGFHLQMNGLAAAWLARLTGAHSAYFSVGGPREVIDGGVWSENRLFARLPGPDRRIEAQLLEAVRETDLVIGMGTRTVSYFAARGLDGRCHVVPGGIDASVFRPAAAAPDLDVVFVGRLVPIKRVDLLLQAVRLMADAVPGLRVALVGDGPLRPDLEALASRLGLGGHVVFTGRQADVAGWLRRAKVFMLTSESEGLALSLMEAMCCGAAPVVADVGDLGDLVRDGDTGYLVAERSAEAFAAPAIALLRDPARLARVRAAAARAASDYTVEATTARWNRILSDLTRRGGS